VRRKQASYVNSFVIFIVIFSSLVSTMPTQTKAADPYFTLVFKTSGGGMYADYGNFLKQHLSRIGINLDILILDWASFISELLVWRNFDICYASFVGGGADPDMTGVYNENGSLNLFGYDTSMDWSAPLGTGLNEWYMKQGTLLMPPDSEERVQHYWDWEDYLMDKICPSLPLFSSNNFVAYWTNLNGYLFNNTLKQSWGKMSWDGLHTGQNSTDEVVITDAAWSDLNPLFQDDVSSQYISSQCLDPLLWYDADMSLWPHLAESYTFINDTILIIEIRDGIFWPDIDSFTNEPFDNKDLYFTFYAWKHLSNSPSEYSWIKDMEMIGDDQLKIYIDGDDTTPESEPYAPTLSALAKDILPEHYLNQTQLGDGVTPDITHLSWESFSNNCIGTSLFEISGFTVGIETVLTVNPDCWWLDPAVDKTNMDFVNRFGNFSSGISQQRVRIIPDHQTAFLEFEAGKVDIVEVTAYPDKQSQYTSDPTKSLQSDSTYQFGFFGFNMRESRPLIGDRTPCLGNSTITKGLAIRKAICYAADRVEINNVIHAGTQTIVHWPIYNKLGIWCNPTIIRYDHDLDEARYYMELAGFPVIENTTTITPTTIIIGLTTTVFTGLIFGSLVLISFLSRKRK